MRLSIEERAAKNALNELAEAASRVQAIGELKEFAAIRAVAPGEKGRLNDFTSEVGEAVARLERVIVDAEEVQHRLNSAINSCRKDEVAMSRICTSGAVVAEVAGARDTVERVRADLQAWDVALQAAIRRAQQVADVGRNHGVRGKEGMVGHRPEAGAQMIRQHPAMGLKTSTSEWPPRPLVGPRGGSNG